jgi:serine O-acetyltransferase
VISARLYADLVGLVGRLVGDAKSLTRLMNATDVVTARTLLQTFGYDGFAVLALTRAREAAARWHVPGANRTFRMAQMVLYGVEISKEARIGEGVCFLHTSGVVIGGDTTIGARTIILGNITIGNRNNGGYPTIGKDVVIGAGARILGPIRVGDGALIGANAVVLTDVPAGATAIGVPAIVRERRERTLDNGRAG